MNLNHLESFLDKWTNWDRVYSGSYSDKEEDSLELSLNIDYLGKNRSKHNIVRLSHNYHKGKKSPKYNPDFTFMGYDKEATELIMEERLIHPEVLKTEIMMLLIEMSRDFQETDFNMQRQLVLVDLMDLIGFNEDNHNILLEAVLGEE
ncbi:MAG: hypothetical protein LBM02_08115 [Lachnospiraceae bacterium]|jgi:hypothetical protein|nr:hypothetical protein [Lachnospiraceae bacterium]